jgi:hypothetical protein
MRVANSLDVLAIKRRISYSSRAFTRALEVSMGARPIIPGKNGTTLASIAVEFRCSPARWGASVNVSKLHVKAK